MVARSPELMYQTSEHSGSNWNLEVLVFRREETNNKLDPYDSAESGNRTPGHMGGGGGGGECPHHCTIPALRFLLAVEKALQIFKSPKLKKSLKSLPRKPEFLEL